MVLVPLGPLGWEASPSRSFPLVLTGGPQIVEHPLTLARGVTGKRNSCGYSIGSWVAKS